MVNLGVIVSIFDVRVPPVTLDSKFNKTVMGHLKCSNKKRIILSKGRNQHLKQSKQKIKVVSTYHRCFHRTHHYSLSLRYRIVLAQCRLHLHKPRIRPETESSQHHMQVVLNSTYLTFENCFHSFFKSRVMLNVCGM